MRSVTVREGSIRSRSVSAARSRRAALRARARSMASSYVSPFGGERVALSESACAEADSVTFAMVSPLFVPAGAARCCADDRASPAHSRGFAISLRCGRRRVQSWQEIPATRQETGISCHDERGVGRKDELLYRVGGTALVGTPRSGLVITTGGESLP